LVGFKNYFLGAVGNGGKKLLALSPTALNIFYSLRQQRLKFFNSITDSTKYCLTMSATALKSTKRRFSGLNHKIFEFFYLGPRSPTDTGLIYVKTLEPNISSLGPFKYVEKDAKFI
jgi:hypothetical protein